MIEKSSRLNFVIIGIDTENQVVIFEIDMLTLIMIFPT